MAPDQTAASKRWTEGSQDAFETAEQLYTHDLPLLAERQGLKLTDNQSKILDQINTFNIAGRYHEEKLALYEKATAEYAQHWLENTKEILTTIL